jgi:UDP-N-acetylmuramoyl-tripeptide--D-alanyl-D-alanine ligase
MEGQLVAGNPEAVWSGAAIDSRRVNGGELFFALPGEQTDGHRFVTTALERGAAAAIVHRQVDRPATGGLILVDDSFLALHALTRHVRSRTPEKLVGVTGSAGKTTTKELLALMLGKRFRIARSPGSLNNLYGFPLALLSIAEATEWMVAEMGMSTPGELSRLSDLCRPNAVVFTNVRPAHLEFFGSVRKIAEAKAEALDGLAPDGLVVANADDPEVMRIAERHSGKLVCFALEGEAEHQAREIEVRADGECRFTWWAHGVSRHARLPLLGAHNVANFLAAAACAVEIGVDPDEVLDAVADAVPAAGRGELHRIREATIVDDSYNSNPAALSASLRSAGALPGSRHWAVLGDMLELGEESETFHREAGAEVASRGFSPVLGVGQSSRALVETVRECGGEGHWFSSAAEAASAATAILEAGDVVLVKGSRGIGLEVVVQRLLTEEVSD